jgi:hypothetical protein
MDARVPRFENDYRLGEDGAASGGQPLKMAREIDWEDCRKWNLHPAGN